VIVVLATERGGNCELSKADTRVVEHGVTILGPTNLPSEIPNHASQMYSNNVTKFLLNLIKDGKVALNLEDEIIRETLVAHDGQLVNARMRDILGLEPSPEPEPEPEPNVEITLTSEDIEADTTDTDANDHDGESAKETDE
jgi:NAD(P) transhydrogenase subunit alpha